MSHLYQCISPDLCISDTQSRSVPSPGCLHCLALSTLSATPSAPSPSLSQSVSNPRHSQQGLISVTAYWRRKTQPQIVMSGQKKDIYLTCFFGLVVTFLFARTIKPFACLTMIPVLWQFLNNIPIIHSFSETRLSFNDENHQVRL